MAGIEVPQCGVCFKDWHHEKVDKQPQVLPCGHSFCAKCVRRLIRTEFRRSSRRVAVCPLCMEKTAQADVRVNYGLRDVVQQLREARAKRIKQKIKRQSKKSLKAIKKEKRRPHLDTRYEEDMVSVNGDGDDVSIAGDYFDAVSP
mmetsp:Transcript_16632/g.39899  ORF Transcript_16632/g.39899 Transcript_16632/m.39899 type:complete len:145 (-) Transcript_16632:223-657(-)